MNNQALPQGCVRSFYKKHLHKVVTMWCRWCNPFMHARIFLWSTRGGRFLWWAAQCEMLFKPIHHYTRKMLQAARRETINKGLWYAHAENVGGSKLGLHMKLKILVCCYGNFHAFNPPLLGSLTLAKMRSATQLRCARACGQILQRSKITHLESCKGYTMLQLTVSAE